MLRFWQNLARQTDRKEGHSINPLACIRHSRPYVTCAECRNICPFGAIGISRTDIQIKQDLCTDCGLCVAACPQNAIQNQNTLEVVKFKSHAAGLAVCHQSDMHSGMGQNHIYCIHAVSLSMLADIYLSGVKCIYILKSDCENCRHGASQRFSQTFKHFNRYLTALRLPSMRTYFVDKVKFSLLLKLKNRVEKPHTLKRREFFKSSLNQFAEKPLEDTAKVTTVQHKFNQLFKESAVETVSLYRIRIDETSCTACIDCVRVCPDKALVLDNHSKDSAFRIQASRCTRCQACADICQQNAITVEPDVSIGEKCIPLQKQTCSCCGVQYYRLRIDKRNSGQCHICSNRPKDQTQALFQVYR